MDSNPIRIHPLDTIAVAARKIMRRRYRSLPVVDDERRFLGVVRVNDMLRLILPPQATTQNMSAAVKRYEALTIEDLRENLDNMLENPIAPHIVKEVVTVAPETSLIETLLTMHRLEQNLPVVDRGTGRLEGMISYYDIGDMMLQGGCGQAV
jgi:CBS-domain-containing membrane protein